MFGQYILAGWVLIQGIMLLRGVGWNVRFERPGIRRAVAVIYFALAALMAFMSWVEHEDLMAQRTYIIVYAVSAGVLIGALLVLRIRYGKRKVR